MSDKFGKFTLGGKKGNEPTADKKALPGQPGRKRLEGPKQGGALVRRGTERAELARPVAGGNLQDKYSVHAGKMPVVAETRRAGNFAIVMDATGSMWHSIENAKLTIQEIVRMIREEGGEGAKIQVIVYRDYEFVNNKDPRNKFPVVEYSPLTEDADVLYDWISTIRLPTYGNTIDEAVEAALQFVLDQGHFDAVMLCGDAPSHSKKTLVDHYRLPDTPTAHELAKRLGKVDVPIHTFLVDGARATKNDWKEISRLSGGTYGGDLSSKDTMRDSAALLMLASMKGVAAVQQFISDPRRQLTDATKGFGRRLLTTNLKG